MAWLFSMAEAMASRRVDSFFTCTPSASATEGAARGAVRVARSFLRILPPGPVPVTCERSIPASAASFRATGDARTPLLCPLPPSVVPPFRPGRGGDSETPSLLAGSTPPDPVSSFPTTVPDSACVVSRGCEGAPGAVAGAGAALVLIRATISPTLTTCPFTRVISTTTPATGEGMSVTTLSVSTTARASPAFTLCPGATFSSTTVPSVRPSPISGNRNSNNPASRLIGHHLSRFGHHPLGADEIVPLASGHGVDHVGSRQARGRSFQAVERLLHDGGHQLGGHPETLRTLVHGEEPAGFSYRFHNGARVERVDRAQVDELDRPALRREGRARLARLD